MRLLKYLCLGAAVWVLYWGLAAWGLRSGLEGWFDAQARQGWQVSHGQLSTAGFPLRHRTRIDQPLLADPGTGAAWSADWLDLDTPALWPGALTLSFPETEQRFSVFDQSSTLTAQDMTAEMQLAPGAALTLERLVLRAQGWKILQQKATTPQWQAQDLELTLQQQSAPPRQYDLRMAITGFAPGGAFRRISQLAHDLPKQFDALQLQGTVDFDTPWDRRALEQRRPQPRQITLTLAEAKWGEMHFRASGQLQMDDQGRATGDLALQVRNWRAILDMAERSSLLPPQTRAAMERVLALFSSPAGEGEKINTTLRFQQGQMWIGPLPIGTAPPIRLR
ncbi:DUF2125 domain-containing protein [Pseudophaeobacter flagellatus]|uniref:DUF2125 domain-containing protein n=1 Tax=Pseudophaeobacter flagellatus TaxID=2899119 RepID=UPI001E2F2641|nr:DUF2125 domain-containing protein [Pseudophaeobacter flagellatus]MCD9149581.1 DUF2125 domain-containing protein [Pseudophaeobacter flagellatus]